MTYSDVVKKLKKLGCEEVVRKNPGSHRYWRNPANDQITSVPDWGSKDLRLGTVRAAIRSLGIAWDDFRQA
jgi:mRNA interferase HicA